MCMLCWKQKKKIYCRSQEAGGNVHDKLHYFHYITPLIRIWIYSFKVTVKAFGSSEFPLWKKPTSHSSLAHWKPLNLVCNNMRWHYDFCTHLSPQESTSDGKIWHFSIFFVICNPKPPTVQCRWANLKHLKQTPERQNSTTKQFHNCT